MNFPTETANDSVLQPALSSMAEHGYAVIEDFLPMETISALAVEAKQLQLDGHMRRAATGKTTHQSNPNPNKNKNLDQPQHANDDARGDFTYWLMERTASQAQQKYLASMEALRTALNRTLYLGLFDAESHFAIYPPGAVYRKHLDQFRRQDGTLDQQRQVSSILYLNKDWQPDYGGQLRMYIDTALTLRYNGADPSNIDFSGTNQEYLDILPNGGRLVIFLSGKFFHEVLPSTQPRLSLTGWFRQRTTALP